MVYRTIHGDEHPTCNFQTKHLDASRIPAEDAELLQSMLRLQYARGSRIGWGRLCRSAKVSLRSISLIYIVLLSSVLRPSHQTFCRTLSRQYVVSWLSRPESGLLNDRQAIHVLSLTARRRTIRAG